MLVGGVDVKEERKRRLKEDVQKTTCGAASAKKKERIQYDLATGEPGD